MKVFLTGATGLVGAHTARELIKNGHEVRFLLRNVDLAREYFSRFDINVTDYVIADMRDADAVKEGIKGCDAVFHAAAMIGLESQKAEETYRNNLDGMKSVVGTAVSEGINNIVYVSSLITLFQPGREVINESSPLALNEKQEAYSRSKLACEEYARNLQESGAPVQISYPGGIFGPDDPRLNETNRALLIFLNGCLPITDSGLQVVDARDLAVAHRLMLEKGADFQPASDRFIIAGHFYFWSELRLILESAAGKKIRAMRIPGSLLRVAGSCGDLLKRICPFEFPLTAEAATISTRWIPADSQKAKTELGLSFRSGRETFADTIRWMIQAGHLPDKFPGVDAT